MKWNYHCRKLWHCLVKSDHTNILFSTYDPIFFLLFTSSKLIRLSLLSSATNYRLCFSSFNRYFKILNTYFKFSKNLTLSFTLLSNIIWILIHCKHWDADNVYTSDKNKVRSVVVYSLFVFYCCLKRLP